MDVDAAIKEVEAFLALLDVHVHDQFKENGRQLRSEVLRLLPLIVGIAEEVDADLVHGLQSRATRGWEFFVTHDAAERLLGSLQHQDRLAEIRGPAGPKLAAARLHRWVWDPAASRWENGKRRDAIQAAATNVFDIQLTGKLDRGPDTKGGKDLAGQAFSTSDPEPNSPRLRLPGFAPGTKDWTSAHEGAMELGQACAQLIRNLTTHDLAEPPEDRALEQLAVLSLFARLVEESVVDTGA